MTDPVPEDIAAASPWPRTTVAWFSLAVLLAAYTLSFVDRTLLTMLVGPVKAELHIGEVQMSLLTGIAFALFYTVLGLPIGTLVDRRDRRVIAAAGVAVWSVMTALCGAAQGFATLLLARIGVGAGEAALSPAAYSLIPDLFRPERRGRAQGVYGMGASLGSGLAYLFGGWVIAAVAHSRPVVLPGLGAFGGWRAAFVVVGLPGLLVALLMLFTREPPRRHAAVEAPTGSVLSTLRAQWRAYLPILLGVPVANIGYHALIAWGPAYFGRVFHQGHAAVGLRLGLVFMLAGCAGLMAGGAWSDAKLRAGRLDANLTTAMLGAGVMAPALGVLALHPPLWVATLAMLAAVGFVSMVFGAAPAALSLVAPNELRGRVAAAYMLALNLVGQGIGPTLAALLTEDVYRSPLEVGRSIGAVGLGAGLLAVALIAAGRPAYRTLAAAQRPTA